MAGIEAQSPRLVTVKVGFGISGAISTLGFTRNGVDITEEPFFINVPGDENGGDDGPPIDVQWVGTLHRIRITLTKWDKAVSDKLTNRVQGNDTPGDLSGITPGDFMIGDGLHNRLILDANDATFDRNYRLAILRDNVEINKGTKFAELVLVYECHKPLFTGAPITKGIIYDRSVA